MILRPNIANRHAVVISVWDAISATQQQPPGACALIRQSDHAHLAGEIAAAIHLHERLPHLTHDVIRGIALHDEGWSSLDGEMLSGKRQPASFVYAAVTEFVAAWTDSIHAATRDSATGGSIVSRHFCRLAQARGAGQEDSSADRQRLRDFLTCEHEQQARLARQQLHREEELERFTDVLQFCDALSLYLCCGALDDVGLPQTRMEAERLYFLQA